QKQLQNNAVDRLDNSSESIINASDPVINQCIGYASSADTNSKSLENNTPASLVHTEIKSLEDQEIDEFLDSKYKEKVSKEIIQNIKEKKLRDQDLSSINQYEQPCQSNSLPKKSSKVITSISSIDQGPTREDTYISNQGSSPIVQVRKAEFHSFKVKILYNQKIEHGIIQEVILFIQKEKSLILSDIKASSQNETNISETHNGNIEINNEKNGQELVQLFSDAEFAEGKTIKAKQKETQRAGNVYKLFGKITDPITKEEIKGIEIDKVCGTSYSVRSISELADAQILNIIKQVTEKTRDILTNGQELNHTVDSKKIPDMVLDELSETKIKRQQHVIEMVLERFLYLTLKHSFKYCNYFDFNRSVLCPLCDKNHKKENIRNHIEGEWGSGEYCDEKTYRLYCYINKYQNSIPIVTIRT
ncbi:25861_t:CDS:2, partial [Gigaspora margarita]